MNLQHKQCDYDANSWSINVTWVQGVVCVLDATWV